MAVAIVADTVKVYPLTQEKPFRDRYLQVLEVELTAANTDTTVDLDALADTTISDFLDRLEKVTSYCFLESPREVAAAGVAHTYNGSKLDPVFTFAGGGTTPTALTLKLEGIFKAGHEPMLSGV